MKSKPVPSSAPVAVVVNDDLTQLTMLAGIPDGIIVHDAEGLILDANEAMAQRLEIPVQKLSGLNIAEFITPDSAANVRDNARSTLAGQSNVFETTYVSASGKKISAEVHERRIQWRKKQVVLSISRDITERKRAEEALRNSEERFRSVIQSLSDTIFIIDRNGKLTYESPAATRILGYSAGYFIGKSPFEHIHPDDLDRVVKDLSEVFESVNPGTVTEFRYRKADGTWINLEALGKNQIENPGIQGIVLTVRDITERLRAEDALRESEELYRKAFMTSPDAIFITRFPDGMFVSVNAGFTKMTGYTEDEIIGKLPLEINIWKDPEERKKIIEEFLTKGEVRNFEARYLTKNGETVTGLISVSRVDLNGVQHNLCIARDITERKALQAQLQQAQKMESVGRLAGGVAHDFNNMLSVILGYSELAIRKAGTDNPLQRHLAQILDAAKRSASLTRQLLAFARQQTIAPIVLDLNKTIEGMLKMLHRLIGEDIDLQWHPKADLWPVMVDPSQIDQILVNLCINARDAIADVGKITIETENSTLGKAYCANHPGFVPGDYLKLTVSDDGCGMDKETQNILFEPFFTTKEMGKGTGLGLATVYGIIKQNKGFINVYSEPGHGTSFTIYLLRHTARTGEARPAGLTVAATRGNETILLVEDEPAILEMATTMLEGQGYTVRVAATPVEALRLAREHKGAIDLLITDVVMPGMNGRDLAKTLMSLYPGIKLLFMSGYTANVIAHQGVLDEGVYFIQKPFSIDDLSAKIREALGRDENPL